MGLTKTQAKEWGPLGIRANAVAFGMIDTRMTNAFAADATVEVGGVAVPQGLPEHVAAAWGADSKMLSAIVPLGRKGTADEAAGGVLFLASPLASCMPEHGSNSRGPRRVCDALLPHFTRLRFPCHAADVTGHTLEVTGGMGI